MHSFCQMFTRMRVQRAASRLLLLAATLVAAGACGCRAALLDHGPGATKTASRLPQPAATKRKGEKHLPEERRAARPWAKDTWKLSRLLNSSSEPQIMKLRRRGVVCTRCCVVPKGMRTPEHAAGGESVHLQYSARSYTEETDWVYAWPAGPQDEHRILPGTSHVVWVPDHSNVQFNLVTGMNSWRTWHDLDVPIDRVMLLRSPRPAFEWLYQQLRGLRSMDAPAVMTEPVCFERVVVGVVKLPLRPYDWHTKCHRDPKLTAKEQQVIGGFASYLQGMLPAAEVGHVGRLDGTQQQCRAFVQLRGAPSGPNREPRGRNWLNSDKAAQVLRDLGFLVDEVDMRATPMHRAGLLLHAADLVVAPHGAGVANVMFCRPGTTLVELHNWGAQKWVYERISRGLGLQYRPLVCSRPEFCPMTDEDGNPVEEKPVRDDRCYRGYLRKTIYNANHLRDINLDLNALQRMALRTALELRAGQKCRIRLPEHLVPPGVTHEAKERPPSSLRPFSFPSEL